MQSSEPTNSEAAPEQQTQPTGGSGNIGRMIKLAAVLGILLILGLLVAALVAALTAADTWMPVIRIFRDVILIILLLESVLLIAAFAILLLQVAGFFIMLRAEIAPILANARETARLGKATATFMNDNAVDPLIQLKSFLAGLLAFLRELLRIRSLMSPDQDPGEAADEADAT
ncbi:MAG: hypothetical protein OXG92_07460 [Chloroflexi bacterium]|nr:hypothetical protein [Chloroflexota bacterium]MCY3716288.1 hypothetical protein [Chloroflexota bacterium]MDE2650213.1 hypothetical protein [Chloroflexota bacterium]MXV93530.1 hypothetical protein [Chloroflexota bacterium]MXX49462.1 hypothetical protein [Chloroflexota bacterium]